MHQAFCRIDSSALQLTYEYAVAPVYRQRNGTGVVLTCYLARRSAWAVTARSYSELAILGFSPSSLAANARIRPIRRAQ